MVYCAALNCQNATSGPYKNSSVSFFGFPLQNQALLRQWIQNMGRDMETPSKYQRLCSEHFEESSFERDPLKVRKSRRLLKEAVPSKFVRGEDGNWRVGTPQGSCGVTRNGTRKRLRNPEHWRVPGMFPQWPRLEDWQNEFCKQLLKEKYGSVLTLGKGYPAPKSHIPAGGAVQVKDRQDLEGRKIPASLSTGHGGAMIRSQGAGGTQPHGSPSGASPDLHGCGSDRGGAPGGHHNPATNPAAPAGTGREQGNSSSLLAWGNLDEFKQFLLYHRRRPEEAEVPWFICTDCGKSFARHAYLLRHQRSHAGQRPHACAECGRRFLDKPALHSHLRTHFRIIRVSQAFLE